MNFLKRVINCIKGSQLVEKILIVAFSVSAGAAVIVYGANVIKASASVQVDEDDLSGRTYGYNQKVLYNSGWGQTNCSVDTGSHTEEVVMISNGQGNMVYTNVLYQESGVRVTAEDSHSYLIRYYLTPSVANLNCNAYYYPDVGIMPANQTTIYDRIHNSNLFALGCHNINISGDLHFGDSVRIKISIIDLTEWYGAGSEPSSVSEFKAKFPNDYYPTHPTPTNMTREQINNL